MGQYEAVHKGGGGLNPEIELVGDWDKVMAVINGHALSAAVIAGAKEGQHKAAKQIVKLVKENINRGGVPGIHWPGFSPSYLVQKARKGGGNKAYIYTGQYYSSISVIVKPSGIYAGIPRWAKGRVNKNSASLTKIARILEYHRPLWKPTFRQFGGKAAVGLYVTVAIKKNLLLLAGVSSIRGTVKLR